MLSFYCWNFLLILFAVTLICSLSMMGYRIYPKNKKLSLENTWWVMSGVVGRKGKYSGSYVCILCCIFMFWFVIFFLIENILLLFCNLKYGGEYVTLALNSLAWHLCLTGVGFEFLSKHSWFGLTVKCTDVQNRLMKARFQTDQA